MRLSVLCAVCGLPDKTLRGGAGLDRDMLFCDNCWSHCHAACLWLGLWGIEHPSYRGYALKAQLPLETL